MARFGVALSFFFFVSSFLLAQQNPPASSLNAATLAAQSVAAMTGGAGVADVTLTGTVTWFAGSDTETGTATLLAKGTGESRMDLNLNSGTRTEIRNASTAIPQGKWLNPNGMTGPFAWHNCWTDSGWFFPVLSSLANFSNSSFVFTYVGQETWNGVAAQHLRVYQVAPTATTVAVPIQGLSMMDFYVDPTSLLPLAVDFNTHPDSDTNTNIQMEVRFANYQAVNGVQIPFHIQRLMNGGLALDLLITNATLNTGLTDSQFSLQ